MEEVDAIVESPAEANVAAAEELANGLTVELWLEPTAFNGNGKEGWRDEEDG